MVRVGGMDPDKRQEMVETESMINRNVKGGGGNPDKRQEMVDTESFLID